MILANIPGRGPGLLGELIIFGSLSLLAIFAAWLWRGGKKTKDFYDEDGNVRPKINPATGKPLPGDWTVDKKTGKARPKKLWEKDIG